MLLNSGCFNADPHVHTHTLSFLHFRPRTSPQGSLTILRKTAHGGRDLAETKARAASFSVFLMLKAACLWPSFLSFPSKTSQDLKRCHSGAVGKCDAWLLFSLWGPSQAFLGPKRQVGKDTACPCHSPSFTGQEAQPAPGSLLPWHNWKSLTFKAWGTRWAQGFLVPALKGGTSGESVCPIWTTSRAPGRFWASFLHARSPSEDFRVEGALRGQQGETEKRFYKTVPGMGAFSWCS